MKNYAFFLNARSILRTLFHSFHNAILRMFSKMNKSKNFTLVLFMFCTLFSRDLKWNSYIHTLIAKSGAENYIIGDLLSTLSITFFEKLPKSSFRTLGKPYQFFILQSYLIKLDILLKGVLFPLLVCLSVIVYLNNYSNVWSRQSIVNLFQNLYLHNNKTNGKIL